MKKKLAMFMLASVIAVNLSACDVGDTGLSESELNQVAEYAAKLVLKHTRNYEPTLQEELEIKENPNIVKEDFNAGANTSESSVIASRASIDDNSNQAKDNEDNIGEDNTSSAINGAGTDADTDSTLSEVYGADGFDIVYGGAGEYSRYPKNEGYFSLVAADNMKLYVVEFSIRNKTEKSKKFLHNDKVGYTLTFDGENYYKPSLTLLENDMQSLDTTIGGGKSSKGVIVFNVAKGADKNKAKLRVLNGEKSYTLTVAQ